MENERQEPRSGARRIAIFDTTLRDGEQSAGVCFSQRDKLDIATRLESLGVDVVEVGFPSSSADEAGCVAAVARALRSATVCALSDAVPAHIDATWEAIRWARDPRLHVVLSSSAIHLAHQLRMRPEEAEERVRTCVAHARRRVANVEFSAMDATRADRALVARLFRAAIAAGATVVNFPDTVGCALPEQIAQAVRELRQRVPELEGVTFSFHGQNDLGLATANSLAAVAAGATQVEVAVNGIGERAGNTSLEEVVMALRLHAGSLGVVTGVDPRGLWSLSRLVEERSGLPVAPNKALVGRNAFRHASGLHQDGVLKRRETYELIDPSEIGHPIGTEIVLGKLSGRHGFAARVRGLGLHLEQGELARAFDRFKALAAQRGEVSDAELQHLCRGHAGPPEAWPGPGV